MSQPQESDKRCQIEVEGKASGLTRILVIATTEREALKLFKKVRKEIKEHE